MFPSLFKPRDRRPQAARTAVPPGVVVWAIGDVHGRLDLLEPLLGGILEDLRQSQAERRIIVGLGDYIDRGLDSRGVIERLCWLAGQPGVETHFLRGNHEDRMEAFLVDPEIGPSWCDYGGREALRSYGVTPPAMKNDDAGWVEACAQLNAALPDRHRDFLSRQESCFAVGDYFFAHAGAKPGVPLADQSPNDLMWVRQAFLSHPAAFEQVVVHGHTPSEAVEADHRRIGLDTGAYATGVLTGLRLEGTERATLQTAMAGRNVRLTRQPL